MTAINEVDTLFQMLAIARRKLTPGAWDYLMGGAETETTLNRNRRALDSWALRARVLRDVAAIDTSTTLLRQKLKLPVVLAPIGSMQDLLEEGGVAPTRAAARTGVVHMLSSVCTPGMEAVAKAADYPKFFQLYIRGDAAWVDDMLKRALDCGYQGICLTVDRANYGRRERDVAKGHNPTARQGAAAEVHQASLTWKDVDRIRSYVKVPLILKGIATAEDAELAVEHGVDCVYVSNHGGRQLDHAQGSVAALPEVVAAVKGRAEIVVDGTILRGTDIIKALSLGANAVGLGRAQGIALSAGGEEAVVRMLGIIENELRTAMALIGAATLSDLGPHCLTPVEPLARNWLESAFPLVREGYGALATEIRDLSLRLPG